MGLCTSFGVRYTLATAIIGRWASARHGREFGEDNARPVRGGGTAVADRDDHSKPHPATFSVLPVGSSKGSRAQDAIRRHRRHSEMRMTRKT
jgi:hypothetical protein